MTNWACGNALAQHGHERDRCRPRRSSPPGLPKAAARRSPSACSSQGASGGRFPARAGCVRLEGHAGAVGRVGLQDRPWAAPAASASTVGGRRRDSFRPGAGRSTLPALARRRQARRRRSPPAAAARCGSAAARRGRRPPAACRRAKGNSLEDLVAEDVGGLAGLGDAGLGDGDVKVASATGRCARPPGARAAARAMRKRRARCRRPARSGRLRPAPRPSAGRRSGRAARWSATAGRSCRSRSRGRRPGWASRCGPRGAST